MKHWATIWQDGASRQNMLDGAFKYCGASAHEDQELNDEPELQLHEVQKAIQSTRNAIGLGVDMVSPSLLKSLPCQGVAALTSLMRRSEIKGVCPAVTYCQKAILIPKASGIGRRPIFLIGLYYRILVKARRSLVRNWKGKTQIPPTTRSAEGVRKGPWSTAISKRRSVPRVAGVRRLPSLTWPPLFRHSAR